MKLWVKHQNDWGIQWWNYNLRRKQVHEVLNNSHRLLIKICGRNIASQKWLLIIDSLVELDHFLHVICIKSKFQIAIIFLIVIIPSLVHQCHWEAIWNIYHFSITCTKKSSNDDRSMFLLFLLRVLQKIWHNLWLNDAMLLFDSAHTEVQIGFDLVWVFLTFWHVQ